MPRFTAKSYAKLIVKYRCNFIAGVPTLYEALLRLPSMDGADLSSLKGVFSGGDSLSIELKKKFDQFLYDHKAVVQVRRVTVPQRPSRPAASPRPTCSRRAASACRFGVATPHKHVHSLDAWI